MTTTPDALSFAIRALGDLLWMIYGVSTGQWSIVVCETAFCLVDMKGAFMRLYMRL